MNELKINGTYPQDMKGGYRVLFSWAKRDDDTLPMFAIDVMLAMLKAKDRNATIGQLYGILNKGFHIVGYGSGEDVLAIYRHDERWQVITFSIVAWLETYRARLSSSEERGLHSIPDYCV